ncbi:MAG TPA: arginine--tRNA ligase [Victivallales bacterium]|nr:arginine--tRNA ligase [Victivallales bacterium]HPO90325.1 arginine--tRNA ligase [Victivallales bacterium]HRR06424.1 arginine--tRNA ligase [Victivallales bacterium]HRR28906.1 arginine--tRNA ligase [Victivallales bacterium]HRU00990.1 arginine--tRNA ligase [Victivallales bacterium]
MNPAFLQNLSTRLAENFKVPSNEFFIFPEIPPHNIDADITINCFRLVSFLKVKPELIAENVEEILKTMPQVGGVQRIKAFVNVNLKPEVLHQECVESARNTIVNSILAPDKHMRILIEFSSPNTNKPLHLGHLRNNAIGNSVAELLKKAGHTVIKVNLINDRGIHICKSMLAYKLFGNNITPKEAGKKGDHLVGDFYVKFDQELKKQIEELKKTNPELRELGEEELFLKTPIGSEAQEMLKKWEEGDCEVRNLWKKMNSWVMEGFKETYQRMGVFFDKYYFESNTYLYGKKIVEEGLQKGIFSKRQDAAIFANLEKYSLGEKVLLRPDGTSVYITQDIGTTLIKQEEFSPDQQIWVVGDEQIRHFQTLFAIMKELGYSWAERLTHLSYGMVNLPSGKMKSREGTVVDADDLFEELFNLAKNATLKRIDSEIPEDINERAELIAMGALKFMLLKFNPKTTITFDPQASVKFEGDTGPYVQYACARINSILKKCSESGFEYNPESTNFALMSSKEERELSVFCSLYFSSLYFAIEKLDPSILSSYLLDLAKKFSRFYREHSILNAENDSLRNARISLALTVRDILKEGLAILGIQVPEAM